MEDELKNSYLERLKEIKEDFDIERAHSLADDLLCEILVDLGYKEIVDLYKTIEKWYA
jgi:hypothetical protein